MIEQEQKDLELFYLLRDDHFSVQLFTSLGPERIEAAIRADQKKKDAKKCLKVANEYYNQNKAEMADVAIGCKEEILEGE